MNLGLGAGQGLGWGLGWPLQAYDFIGNFATALLFRILLCPDLFSRCARGVGGAVRDGGGQGGEVPNVTLSGHS